MLQKYTHPTLQVATILVAVAPKILELATWFENSRQAGDRAE